MDLQGNHEFDVRESQAGHTENPAQICYPHSEDNKEEERELGHHPDECEESVDDDEMHAPVQQKDLKEATCRRKQAALERSRG